MRCVECGAENLCYRVVKHAGALSDGRTFTAPINALHCLTCGETFTAGADVRAAEVIAGFGSDVRADVRVSA